ncbi:MAG: HAD-IC family P-type ATPase [Rhodocyclaceae bacterium]|nr:HAD-IC family P-type ATPase [Rhodocyclaceae bacterium]
MSTPDWHALSREEALARHQVGAEQGLSDDEAAARLAQHGPNRLPEPQPRPAWKRLLDQLAAPLVLVLILAGTITAFLGEWVDSGVIFGVVAVNAIIGFIQEGKAAQALAALAKTVASEATVLRAGRRQRLDAARLVPGDIVVLAAGDKVPADLRLLSAKELRTVEAALTGESLPVDKHSEPLPIDTALADRRNMAYAGTTVVSGHGHGLVVATGTATATGRISGLIAAAPDLSTPLTRKMAAFASLLLWAILGLAAFTFAVGLARGQAAFDMFMAAVALAVGAIPEGLPAAITITLAIGVSRMAKRRAIVRQLPAVEALGSTTVICSDKTGTLTENAMTVRALWAGGLLYEITGHGYAPEGELLLDGAKVGAGGTAHEVAREALLAGLLCNDAGLAHVKGQWQVTGDPTEAALIVAARKAGLDAATVAALFPRLDTLPFDSARQTMATLHEIEGERMLYAKGALERLLPAASHVLDGQGRVLPLEAALRDDIEAAAAALARQGQRVLALCRRPVSEGSLSEAQLKSGLTFLGLVGMIDPPRPRAIAAVRTCHAAGIAVKMITGDHAETALAIARQLGIVGAIGGRVLTGRELAALDDAQLTAAVREVAVFARVEPEQKLRLVKALQANGEIVAMTGDGVNDAPALKAADIGIAMGLSGTEVAKEAAAMVLTDDNFATIEAAIEEGRGIYDNIVKFITWTLPTNFGEGLVILAAIAAGTTLPITPLQILWVNMTTAILLGLPLAFEPKEHDVMRRPPRPPAAPILDAVLIERVLMVGFLMLTAAFGLFQLALERGATLPEARSIAVNVFVMIETAFLFNCRSLSQPLWRISPFSNPWVWAGAGSMLLLQLAFTYLPPFQRVFGTAAIGLAAWGEIVAAALAALVVMEIEKSFLRR